MAECRTVENPMSVFLFFFFLLGSNAGGGGGAQRRFERGVEEGEETYYWVLERR